MLMTARYFVNTWVAASLTSRECHCVEGCSRPKWWQGFVVIGNLIIRKARRRLERATGRQGVCRSRRHGDVFGIAAGADRQVAGADENRLAQRRLGGGGAVGGDGGPEPHARGGP